MTQNFVGPKFCLTKKREKTEFLNLRLSKLARAKGLLKLEFDSKDQVLLLLHFKLKTSLLYSSFLFIL